MVDNVVTVKRRHLLAAASLPVLASLPAPLARAADPEVGQVIAFVTDVHVDPEDPDKSARAQVMVDALIELDPDLVIHGGDLTEHGSVTEFRHWIAMFPAEFGKRIHHVPGNHEAAWIGDAYEGYHAEIGKTEYSIDLDDVHIVFTNPSIHQQSVADYDKEQLSWLRKDLAKAKGRPILVVGHHIVALTPNQVRNGDRFLDVLTEAEAHAFLCGHIHSERHNVVNGLVELTGEANAEQAGYYLLTRRTTADSDVFEVERVDLDDPVDPDLTAGRRSLPPITLAADDRNRLRPESATAELTDTGIAVRVTLRDDVEVETVQAALMGHAISKGNVEGYQTLSQDGSVWTITLDPAEVVPGHNRVMVRVTGDAGSGTIGADLWHTIIHFEVDGFLPDWTTKVRGNISAGLVAVDDVVIAASNSGDVFATTGSTRRARRAWSTRIGAIHNHPVLDDESGRIILPSADHHLYALDVDTGQQAWSSDLGAPVMSDLSLHTVDDERVILAIAVDTLFCVGADDGQIRWQRQLEGISRGRATCDGEQVYLGVGDGCNWAFDARTGEPVWNVLQAGGREGTYRRLIYGPWQAQRLLLPDDRILTGSRASLLCLSRTTGEQLWQRDGGFAYTFAPRMWGDQVLAIEDTGIVLLLDPATGEASLEVPSVVPYMKNADCLVRDSTVFVTGAGGLVGAIDLDNGTARRVGQISTDYVFSSPVLSSDGSRYVVATMGGELRSYSLD